VEGLSLDEAADILDIAKDAVKSSLCQARRKMRQRLSHLLDGRQVRESYSPRSSMDDRCDSTGLTANDCNERNNLRQP
jgi:hypothetical protein